MERSARVVFGRVAVQGDREDLPHDAAQRDEHCGREREHSDPPCSAGAWRVAAIPMTKTTSSGIIRRIVHAETITLPLMPSPQRCLTRAVERFMASSSERSDALEVLQSQTEEGPCIECYARGSTVFSEDLAAELGRWPSFAPAAVGKGFRSVQALPMRVRGQTIGALNMFRAECGRLTTEDMSLGQGIADIASIALLQERALSESHAIVAQLQSALNSRVIIEQAKGILTEQAGISLDAAFARLRTHARAHNLRLAEVARALIDGQLSTETLTTRPSSSRQSFEIAGPYSGCGSLISPARFSAGRRSRPRRRFLVTSSSGALWKLGTPTSSVRAHMRCSSVAPLSSVCAPHGCNSPANWISQPHRSCVGV